MILVRAIVRKNMSSVSSGHYMFNTRNTQLILQRFLTVKTGNIYRINSVKHNGQKVLIFVYYVLDTGSKGSFTLTSISIFQYFNISILVYTMVLPICIDIVFWYSVSKIRQRMVTNIYHCSQA